MHAEVPPKHGCTLVVMLTIPICIEGGGIYRNADKNGCTWVVCCTWVVMLTIPFICIDGCTWVVMLTISFSITGPGYHSFV